MLSAIGDDGTPCFRAVRATRICVGFPEAGHHLSDTI